jgi:porin
VGVSPANAGHGVSPFADFIAEGWGNVSGGLRTGAVGSQFLDFGVDLDLEKIGGWRGGSFMAEGHWMENYGGTGPLGERTGAFNPVSNVAAERHLRVYHLFYRQTFANGRALLKMGQLAVDDDFMASDYAGLFLNSSFGAMPSQVDSPQFPVWPVAAPGIFIMHRPADWCYWQAGLYHGKPGDDVPGNYGFEWARQSNPGVSLFYETSFNYSLAGRKAMTRLGGTFHSGDAPDYAAINAGHASAVRHGTVSVYAIQDWAIVQDEHGDPRVGLFVRGGFKPEPERRLVGAYADAGLNWFGPIHGRKDDVAGIAVAWTKFGSDYRRSTGYSVANSDKTLELTYKAQVTRGFSLQADVQFLFDPARNASGSRSTATVLGLRAALSF